MKLFGYELIETDRIYSESMGFGTVKSVGDNFYFVNHSGQSWKYGENHIRSGCKLSDISWQKREFGNQIKGKHESDTATKFITAVQELLQVHYGNSN